MTASGSRPIEMTVLPNWESENKQNSRPSFNSIRNPLELSGGTNAAAVTRVPLKLNETEDCVGIPIEAFWGSKGDDRLLLSDADNKGRFSDSTSGNRGD